MTMPAFLTSRILMLLTLFAPLVIADSEPQPSNNPTTTRFSMAISGGVSLGAYEAGLNWAILKQMRLDRARIDNGDLSGINPQLVSIAGASAGGINTLLTAMNWCMLDSTQESAVNKNVFYDNWKDIGLEKLLPADSSKYRADDGLFSRAAFKIIAKKIVDQLDDKHYRTDCNIPFALTVTRTVPLIETIAGIPVRNSHFTIPLQLVSSKVNQSAVVIKNFLVDGENNPKHEMLGNILYLPEYLKKGSEADGKIIDSALIESVANATSAFPIAFGRIEMEHCVRSKNSDVKDHRCPEGYQFDTSYFVDGGVFDNVPLGSAVALAEGKLNSNAARTYYIYMSPRTRRPASNMLEVEIDKTKSYGVMQQLGFLTGAIATGTEHELYNALVGQHWEEEDRDSNRRLLLTSRFSPLIGNYLSHFGAFIDSAFRDYDYYAGIYDAINAIAVYKCSREKTDLRVDDTCVGKKAKITYDALAIDADAKAQWVYRTLAEREHHFIDNQKGPWGWLTEKSNTLTEVNRIADIFCNQRPQQDICAKKERQALIEKIKKNPHNEYYLQGAQSQNLYAATTSILEGCDEPPCEEPPFEDFLRHLIKNYDKNNFSANKDDERNVAIYSLMQDNRQWFAPFVTRASQRLLDLERKANKEKETSLRGAFGFLAYGAEKLYGDEPVITFNQGTTKSIWFRLLPYEINRDARNSEWGVSWEPKIRINETYSINMKTALYQAEQLIDDKVSYAQLDAFWVRNDKSRFISSAGIGPNFSRTYQQYDGFNRYNYGASVFLGLAGDTLRITAGVRSFSDTYPGAENFLYIGITDIPGLLYWAYRSY